MTRGGDLLAWQPSPYFDYSNDMLRRTYETLSRQLLHERNLDYARKAADQIDAVRDEMDRRRAVCDPRLTETG